MHTLDTKDVCNLPRLLMTEVVKLLMAKEKETICPRKSENSNLHVSLLTSMSLSAIQESLRSEFRQRAWAKFMRASERGCRTETRE